MKIRVAESDREIRDCHPVLRQLRPLLTAEAFLERVRAQCDLGYRLAYLESAEGIVAVAGFQIRHTLVDGRYLHVDDLVTLESQRSRGHGAALLAWLRVRAEELSCGSVQLDSGVQRKDAHRFYQREGLNQSAYHFVLPLAGATR
jgi:GNAT superfamily N-acetyltransferase